METKTRLARQVICITSTNAHLGFMMHISSWNCALDKGIRCVGKGVPSLDVVSFVNSHNQSFRFFILQADLQFPFDAKISLRIEQKWKYSVTKSSKQSCRFIFHNLVLFFLKIKPHFSFSSHICSPEMAERTQRAIKDSFDQVKDWLEKE